MNSKLKIPIIILENLVNFNIRDFIKKCSEKFDIDFNFEDYLGDTDLMPVIVYISGDCVKGALKKISCDICSCFLTIQKDTDDDDHSNSQNILIDNMSRGRLIYPNSDIVITVVIAYYWLIASVNVSL